MCLKVALSVVKICRHKLILTTEWGLACFLKVSGVKPAIHKNRKSPQPGWKQGGRGGWDQVAQLETAQQRQSGQKVQEKGLQTHKESYKEF